MKRAIVAVLLAAMAVVALGADINGNDPAAIQKAVSVKTDPYSPLVIYSGPQVDYKFPSGHFMVEDDGAASMLQHVCTKKTGVCTNMIFIVVSYNDTNWRFISDATLLGGQSLTVVPESRNVIGCDDDGTCDYNEMVNVLLPSGFLHAHAASGFTVKVGIHVYKFNGPYVTGFLAALPNTNTSAASPPVATSVR